MEAATSLLNLQRLHELIAELRIEGASAGLPGIADSGDDERNAQIRSVCERILRELASRVLPAQSDAARKLGGVTSPSGGARALEPARSRLPRLRCRASQSGRQDHRPESARQAADEMPE